jgi:hypothetical protein
MLPIYFDWIVSALLAAWVGFAQPRSWRFAATLCVPIALMTWLATYPLIVWGTDYGGDTALAEDYINGFGYASPMLAAAAFPLVWTCIWFGLGSLTLFVTRRARSDRHVS